MNKYFHFPKANQGTGMGFNEGGIDKFHDRWKLWRETVQNVGDNRFPGSDKPAKIKFEYLKMDLSLFGINKEFKETFNACHQFNIESGSDKDTVHDFFKTGKKLLKSKKIDVLKISDYNCRGFWRDPENQQSNFYRLLIAPGSSKKTGGGGGSFGHGQKAPFAQSHLRTVFYYSYVDKWYDGNDGSEGQGIKGIDNKREIFYGKSILNEYKDLNGERRQGVGYYGDTNSIGKEGKNIILPLFDENIPNKLRRKNKNTGLDIYIVGYKHYPQWKTGAINTCLKDFYAAIKKGVLTIEVKDGNEEKVINSKNIIDVVSSNKNLNQIKYKIQALDNEPETKTIKHLGKVSLYINQTQGANSTIDLMRKPLMRIKDYKKPILSDFCGVFVVDDNKGNDNMRLVEDPSHTKIDPALERINNIQISDSIEQFITEVVEKLIGKDNETAFNIPGLGRVLPADMSIDIDGKSDGDNKEENISLEPKSISITTEIKKKKGNDNIITRLFKKIRKRKPRSPNPNPNPNPKPRPTDEQGDGFLPLDSIKVNTFAIGVNKEAYQKYRAIVIPSKDLDDGYIGFCSKTIDGEIDRVNLLEAQDYDGNLLEITKNKIKLSNIKKNKKIKIDFQTNIKVKAALVMEG